MPRFHCPQLAFFMALVVGAACSGEREASGGRAARVRPDSARCAALQPSDAEPSSRLAFLHEVLDARPTRRTASFRDLARSYHVSKPDLAAGLVEVADACGLPLTGIVIIGPVGGLWAYHVLAILNDSGSRARLNLVVMPHARITYKATGTESDSVVTALLGTLTHSPLTTPGAVPAAARTKTDPLGRDFAYELLVLERGNGITRTWSAPLLMADSVTKVDTLVSAPLLERVNRVIESMTPTYKHGDPPPR